MSCPNPLLNAKTFIQTFLRIRTKAGEIIPFKLNPPQQRLYDTIKEQQDQGLPVRIIILKARQMGFSTFTEGLIFWKTVTNFNISSMIVAHQEQSTANLFTMSKRFWQYLPDKLKPMKQADNGYEMVFDRPTRSKSKAKGLGSRIKCATAGGNGVGRSDTIQNLHASEYAFWAGDKVATLNGLMQAVPDLPNTMVVIESTADGHDDFKKKWDRAVYNKRNGLPGFTPVFFAWWEMPEYRKKAPAEFQRTDEEEELAALYGLDDEQLQWRRWCIEVNCDGDINLFHQEYPSCPDEAFLATGSCVFDQEKIIARRAQVEKEHWEYGSFRITRDAAGKPIKGTWQQEKKGPIRIRVMPEDGAPYVIGGDTAGTGSDFFASHVLDNRTGDQVAVLHRQQMGEREYGEQMYCLGKFYNIALEAIETNYSTYPEMVLEELHYPRLYVRERMDTYTGKMVEAYGFNTNSVSRPLIIDELKDLVANHIECIHDYETLGEMLVFIYNDQWRPEAEVGEHDDLIMSLAIANHARRQQTTQTIQQKEAEAAGRSRWTKDMLEDFKHANAEERAYLISRWGQPR